MSSIVGPPVWRTVGRCYAVAVRFTPDCDGTMCGGYAPAVSGNVTVNTVSPGTLRTAI